VTIKLAAACALVAATVGCSFASGPVISSEASSRLGPSGATNGRVVERRTNEEPSSTPIKHVVFIIQENRSFNDLFMGFPGAKTATFGYTTDGRKVAVKPHDLAAPWNLGHSSAAYFADCNGTGSLPGTDCKMNGWENEKNSPNAPKDAAYSYVPRDEIEPYWDMAKQYVIADRMFPSNLDGSFVSHQYLVAAYASSAVDYPLSSWGCEGGKSDTVETITQQRTLGSPIRACFSNPTIATEADAAHLSWRFYAGTPQGDGGFWSSYQADRKVYDGPDWNANVISPPTQFLQDISKGLADVTWITPEFSTSDHPGFDSSQGPAWVASLVNAIGTSKYWNSCAIFIMWDDWGGFFDPVKPIFKDYDGLGFRVPLLIVSPYAKRSSVTHVQYETASVLRFIEDNFGLPQLAASDKRASDPARDPAAFDFNQKPRAFKGIPGGKAAAFWIRSERSPQRGREAENDLGD
jgi:phospholipase C